MAFARRAEPWDARPEPCLGPFSVVAGVVLAIMAVSSICCGLARSWSDWSVPMWVSWVGLVIAGGLAFFRVETGRARRTLKLKTRKKTFQLKSSIRLGHLGLLSDPSEQWPRLDRLCVRLCVTHNK